MLTISPLFSGSSGNSTYISSDEHSLLIDAGVTGKQLDEAFSLIKRDPSKLGGILITHEHSDHIKGVGVISRRYGVPVYANAPTWEAMEGKLGKIAAHNIRIIDDTEFYIGDICVKPIPLHHDAVCPRGYSVFCGSKKFTVLTDTGHITRSMLAEAAGSDIVLLESNHDVEMLKCGSYPFQLKQRILSGNGHMSNDDAATVAVELVKSGVRGILLGHLSLENNFPSLAQKTVSDGLVAGGVVVGKDVALQTARRLTPTGVYILK